MTVTKKFIIIELCSIPLLILAAFTDFPGLVFLSCNIISFAVLLMDYFISPKETAFIIKRGEQDKLYFKTDNKIVFTVTNHSHRTILLELKDEIPSWHFTVTKENLSHVLQPFCSETYDYDLIPAKRGSFLFKAVHVKYKGVLGLCSKFFILDEKMEYKVYPNLRDLSKYRLITQKNRLLSQGEKTISIVGQGMEFESLREYVEGDDYRRINWPVTARENKPIINQYESEKNQPVFILLDTGRPMSYSIKGYKKLDYAINASLILSDIINQKGDKSGLVIFDTDIKTMIMPGKGEVHRNTIMESLYHIEDTKNTSDYEGVFKEIITRQKRRSIVFVFTDFETLDEANELSVNIKLLAKRHIPIIILMKNENLHGLLETSPETPGEMFRKGMAMEFLEERRKIIRTLGTRNVFCAESSAEDFALNAVNYFLYVKNKNLL